MQNHVATSVPTGAYRLADLRQWCRNITAILQPMTLAGHRLVVHDVHPHLLPTGYTVREHVHSYYEGHVVLEGNATYIMGTPQPLGPGSVLLHGPHRPHTWQTTDDTCLRLLFWFSLDPVVQPAGDLTWPVWPDALWDVALLMLDAQATASGWQQRVQARTGVVISRLLALANWPEMPEPEEAPEPTLVEIVEGFMRDNLARPLTLEDVAGHLGVSTRTLCRQFQRLAGVTVMEHLLTLRMDRAAELLTNSDTKLAVIADQVGLPEPSYFCRCFRHHFHTSPKRFRAVETAATITK